MKFITKASSRTNNAYRTVLFIFSVSALVFSVVKYSTLYWSVDTNIQPIMQVVSVSEDYDSLHYDELNGYYIGSDIYDDIGYLPDTLSHLIM